MSIIVYCFTVTIVLIFSPSIICITFLREKKLNFFSHYYFCIVCIIDESSQKIIVIVAIIVP